MKRPRRWPWLLALVPILVLAGFVMWANTPAKPMPEVPATLQSDAQVRVDTEPWLVFHPADEEATVGLILYPGGRVDARAYAPTARDIAAEGYLTVIVPMPLNLAVFGSDIAKEVIAAFPQVNRWAIGGHSLGGAMAARFAYRHPDAVQGLALWASYPAGSDDLSDHNLAVVSIYGMRDGLASEDKIAASQALLPPDTRWVAIQGGNHAQFGWYGPQNGDEPPTISRARQQQVIVQTMLDFLNQLKSRTS